MRQLTLCIFATVLLTLSGWAALPEYQLVIDNGTYTLISENAGEAIVTGDCACNLNTFPPQRNLLTRRNFLFILPPDTTTTTVGTLFTPKSTTKLLTGSTKLADHHLFPRQFQKFFKSNGVNIDDFTVTVDHNVTHLKGIHGKGNLGQMPGKWNKAWADFIRNNPNASQKQIFQQAGKMMDEFGIGHLPIHKFKN